MWVAQADRAGRRATAVERSDAIDQATGASLRDGYLSEYGSARVGQTVRRGRTTGTAGAERPAGGDERGMGLRPSG